MSSNRSKQHLRYKTSLCISFLQMQFIKIIILLLLAVVANIYIHFCFRRKHFHLLFSSGVNSKNPLAEDTDRISAIKENSRWIIRIAVIITKLGFYLFFLGVGRLTLNSSLFASFILPIFRLSFCF